MTGSMDIYELDPALDHVQISPNQLVFRGPAGGFSIHDKMGLINAALECIKTGQPLDQAFSTITPAQDRQTAKQHVLTMLEGRGIIRKKATINHADTDVFQAWLRFVGRNKHAQPRVGLMGPGVLANCVRAELSVLGLKHTVIEQADMACDVGLFCQDAPDEGALRQANQRFVDAGTPYLPVSVDRHIISTGPIIIPGATACAECAYHRRRMNADDRPVSKAGPAGAASDFTTRLAAMFAVEEVLRFVFGVSYDLHTASLTRYSVVTGRRKHSVILRVPRCPVCSPERTRARPLADTFTRFANQAGEFAA